MTMIQTSEYPDTAACSTCQIHLRNIEPVVDEEEANEKQIPFDEKWGLEYGYRPQLPHYQSECCGRFVCALCVERNPRFITYCPFCPIKRPPTPNNPEDTTRPSAAVGQPPTAPPPPYSSDPAPVSPPPYPTDFEGQPINFTQSLMHYLQPGDTISTISLRYSIPTHILRSHNRLYSDHLIAGRGHILVPRQYYTGPSLSPNPVQSVEESLLKRFQIKTKCVEYDIAKLYLDESGWDFDKAVEKWTADEKWEQMYGGMPSGSNPGSSSRVSRGKSLGKPEMSAGMRKGFFR
ncbi:hypothetical protein H072_4852 [Dactylellina haptotyla CBS 200.50]|uniref:LysM domain-containing protein n=1 Tax=Dactylellina haptotyla (strain CBS 200.50) TaxID=1284197 RepID=S8AEF8_DACHA|nr:hypothetical protein H072_4852 [Dactylellina haptotyla CBS 200.50]